MFLTWCFKKVENTAPKAEETADITSTASQKAYTWKYTALYPFGVKIEQKPDYSWMTVNKLYSDPAITRDSTTHCGKDFYFLNAIYQDSKKEGTWYRNFPITIQQGPTKEPLYFDWEPYLKVWDDFDDLDFSLETLEGNLFLTGYLKTSIQSACVYCDDDEEEQKKSGTVEVWGIYPENSTGSAGFVLWYTDGNHIVALYPNLRYDAIDNFSSYEKCTQYYDSISLRSLANDGKIHTFRVVLDDSWAQERAYFGSMIRERDFVK